MFYEQNQGNPRVRMFDEQRNFYVGHQGDGGHYAEAVLKGPRLEIPLFNGDDPIDWLKQCEKFFELTGTPMDQWVNMSLAHFQGRAAKWFRGVGLPWQIISWPQWCAMISTRFSAANVHEAVELFQNVKQYGMTVEQYIDKFEEYVDLVRRDHPYLQEQHITSCFIGGLRSDIKHDVCGQKPQGLLESYWYAKTYEKAANAKRNSFSINRNRNQNFNMGNQGRNQAGKAPQRNEGEKKEEKKCWFCKEPWFPRHQCKVKQALHALLLEDEEVEENTEEKNGEVDLTEENDDMADTEEKGKEEELMFVSLNALQGTSRPDTFLVIILINGRKAVGLIDSGSTSTFMDQEFAIKSQCPLKNSEVKKVVVARGGELRSEVQVPEIQYVIQGEQFSNPFNLIPLKGYDIILGADWIFQYSAITLYLKKRILEITTGGKKLILQDFTKPGKHVFISNKKMERVVKKGAVGCVFQVCEVTEEKKEQQIPIDISNILKKFPAVMKEPQGLPPRRACDHMITLKAGAEHPNLRAY